MASADSKASSSSDLSLIFLCLEDIGESTEAWPERVLKFRDKNSFFVKLGGNEAWVLEESSEWVSDPFGAGVGKLGREWRWEKKESPLEIKEKEILGRRWSCGSSMDEAFLMVDGFHKCFWGVI